MEEYITIWDAHVSPDRKTLAFTGLNRATSKWELVLADTAGKRQIVAWSDDERFYFQGWLNNHQLVVRQSSVYIIVDPYQNLQEKLNPAEFPDFDTYNERQFFVAFDPLLEKAIYKYGDSILLDLNTMKILARIQDGYDRIPIVAWLPSGERAAVVGTLNIKEKSFFPPDEIFIVERDGQVEQLTHLYEIFGRGFEIDHLSWSPDGTKIAFGGSISDRSDESIVTVVDVLSGKMLNYCALNIFGDNSSLHISAPVWSPDGKQFLVEHLYQGGSSVLWVVDANENVAFIIAENQSPIGWTTAP
ncbi:MAG: hypothetical protein CVU44_08405 [Chloroflexi bacterium HGW-Chloroflexi-6]|nr:MAG: hypothetical protein CVU44_08405 [Chloroflexi bacterium HGW-Chloroflexi-6]